MFDFHQPQSPLIIPVMVDNKVSLIFSVAEFSAPNEKCSLFYKGDYAIIIAPMNRLHTGPFVECGGIVRLNRK